MREGTPIEAPREITLDVHLPQGLINLEEISQYLWENYHFEIETNTESDEFEQIFYNNDLRSQMGLCLNYGIVTAGCIRLFLMPKYYLEGDTNQTTWGKNWIRLLKNSIVVPDERLG